MLWLASIAACALTNPRATILDMGLVPDPPVPNQPLDLWVHYQLNGEPVTAGTATQSASVNYIPLSPDVQDLCTQTACPIAAGYHNETSRSVFPADVKGFFSTKIQWDDENGQPIWCVQMKQNVQEDTQDWVGSSSSSGSGSSSSSGSGSSSSSGSGSSSSSGSGSSSSSSGSGSSSSSSGSGSSSSSSGNSSSSSGSSFTASASRAVALRGTAHA